MNDTPGYVKNLKKESVVQSVINCLTDAMRNKELKPGDRIPPEPELAASMGVARSSVREAIKILSYLGVLESKRSEGHLCLQRLPGEHDRSDDLRHHPESGFLRQSDGAA